MLKDDLKVANLCLLPSGAQQQLQVLAPAEYWQPGPFHLDIYVLTCLEWPNVTYMHERQRENVHWFCGLPLVYRCSQESCDDILPSLQKSYKQYIKDSE